MLKHIQQLFLSEKVILSVIVFNAMLMFIMAFPEMKHNTLLWAIDYACLLFFLVEAIVKLRAYGAKLYFSSNWNKFDFFIFVGL